MNTLFPIGQLIMCAFASLVYLWEGDWGRAVYWGAASILTATVTFWIK